MWHTTDKEAGSARKLSKGMAHNVLLTHKARINFLLI